MSLRAELEDEMSASFKAAWSLRDGTVLYADLADSTVLVDTYKKEFAAEIYKAFLRCAARIIRSNDGAITAYDGDRVMAVFIGGSRNSSAARTGLITKAVYDRLSDKSKYSSGTDMWERRIWTAMNDEVVYRSSYWWSL